jgi:hypothetical protein
MRYNSSERQRRIALARGFDASNLTKAEYCRRHGLSANSFAYWYSEANKAQPEGIVEAAFFQVQVEEGPPVATPRQPDLEVELPLGVKLRFFGTGVLR